MFHQRSGRLILSRNMETKTTTINGKEVTLCYCYATEINFAKLTDGENASVFIQETAKKLDALSKCDATAQPDIEKCIYLILAAAIAYYKSKGEECPITDEDLLFSNSPTELYEAAGAVILLYGSFYKLLPGDEPKTKGKGSKGKN
jgi:hypothetical protein